MTEYTLTMLDVRRVQRYIFGANKLKQNVGASELVNLATHDWVCESLPELRSILNSDLNKLESQTPIEQIGAGVEIVYAGGGNVALLFDKFERAIDFTREFTKKCMEEAPGMEVAVAHRSFNWKNERLVDIWQDMQTNVLPARKEGRVVAEPIAGLSVTAQCAFTGGPAVKEEDGVLISAEVKAKLACVDKANRRLADIPTKGYEFPRNFDDFGHEKGRFSYIAVVHADGNCMGDRLKSYAEKATDNRDWIRRIREFSRTVNNRSEMAIQSVHQLMMDCLFPDKKSIVSKFYAEMELNLTSQFLPFRPIVFGGDDVTFVCSGRLGLSLAVKFLQSFHDGVLADGQEAHACAGVAVVHAHYPFAQAYALADELCKAAKKELRDNRLEASAINWHIATSGLLGDWEEIRQREYLVGEGDLHMRPLFLTDVKEYDGAWRSWGSFQELDREFRIGEDWRGRRNKIKDLRAVLREGKQATREFTDRYGELPYLNEATRSKTIRKEGWHDERCVYFDVVEAADFFMILE